MDPEMLDLLQRLSPSDDAEPLSDAELSQLAAAIVDVASTVDISAVTDDDLQVLDEANEHLTTVRQVQAERLQAVEARNARAAEILAKITPSAPVVEEAAVEEPVAASAGPQLPSISSLARRRPATRKPVVASTESASRGRHTTVLTAAGMPVDDGNVVTVMHRALEAERRETRGIGGKHLVLTAASEWPEERQLDMNEVQNEDRIQAVAGPQALQASGGICGPVAADFSLQSIAQAGRPVRDSLPQFAATRGGVRFILPHTLSQVTADGPSGVWTAANDASPGSNGPATKVMATLTCQGVQEVLVSAITSLVSIGNMQARFFEEQVAQYLSTADAVHARLAESTLLGDMYTGSVQVNAGSKLTGATSEFLADLDRIIAGMRYRHRMAPEAPLDLLIPEFLEDLFRADEARELPGNSGGQSERLAIADAEMARWFAVRGVHVTKFQDAPTGTVGQSWGTQYAGDALNWPSKVTGFLYPTGSWLFLDGGELNVGIIRDVATSRVNNLVVFRETFERVAYHGAGESLAITWNIVPSGARAGTVDVSTLSVSGS